MTQPPRRLLLVSATIGEGHNATARAVEEAARNRWPDCEVSWVDALEVMGSWVPATFQRIYVANVESTPWLYDFFYAALWRQRWFADACRRFVGAWSGRRMRALLAARRPDLIVSTYPLGTAGLDWLRKRGELNTPIAAVVSDFAPHPFWVYSGIDLHHVMSEASAHAARRAQPRAVSAVSAPPVVARFHPRDKAEARRARGLPAEGFEVLISCGSLGFGSVERAVHAALSIEVDRVLVVCGRNDALRDQLLLRAAQDNRLEPLGWVDDMPERMAAADVVVTNAGGATALEALACARPVLMFEPIAGHGRANAELMAEAGLAELCEDQGALTRTLRRLLRDPAELHAAEDRMSHHLRGCGEFHEQVADLARLEPGTRPHRLRAQDSFFVHTATPEVAQQTGAVLSFGTPGRAMTISDWMDHLGLLITSRAPTLPMLSHRLVKRRFREPHWVPVRELVAHEHLRYRELSGDPGEREAVEREFFATPVRTGGPPWEMTLVHVPAREDTKLLVKMHHSLGDGLVMTSTLLRLLCDDPPELPDHRPAPQSRVRRALGVLGGLVSLATAGTAPGRGGRSTSARRFAWGELATDDVRATARAHGVNRSALLLAVIAEALHLLDEQNTSPRTFRAMVPRRARPGDEEFGNHAVAVTVDLPVGPMPPRRRVVEVASQLDEAQRRGQPLAAEAVLRALGQLPAPVHAWASRRIYGRRFFQAVISIMPGYQQPARVASALLHTVHPVLPLAEGVGLAIGVIHWAKTAGIGVTADAGLLPDPDKLADQIPHAFAAVRGDAPGGEGS